MKRLLRFLQAREPFHVKAASGLFTIAAPNKELPPITPVPKGPWFLAVYVRDVLSIPLAQFLKWTQQRR